MKKVAAGALSLYQMPLATFLCVEIEYYCIWKFMKDGGIIFDIGSV